MKTLLSVSVSRTAYSVLVPMATYKQELLQTFKTFTFRDKQRQIHRQTDIGYSRTQPSWFGCKVSKLYNFCY